MSVTTTRYVRKPLLVDAVRITDANFEDISKWCQGEIQQDDAPVGTSTGKKFIKIRVHNPKNPRQTKAFVGDWLLYTERGYKVYTNKAFHASFDEYSTVEPPVAYPYDGGGVTVLGPELFVSQDNEVVCWKGTNYVKQDNGQTIQDAIDAAHVEAKNGATVPSEIVS